MSGELLSAGVALVFLTLLLLERTLVARGARWAVGWGLPLGEELVPLPSAPRGEGRTRSVCWRVEGRRALWWPRDDVQRVPSGLHGVVDLLQTRDRVRLIVRWAPPVSPLGAAAWLALVGTVRGDGPLAVALAVGLATVILWLYHRAALRVAHELRWAWVSGERTG